MEPVYYPIEFNENGSRFTILNSGTAPAPCVITFIPKIDFIRLEIKGLSELPIVVRNIYMGDTLVIDAENKKVLVNDEDAFDKYDAWEFPKLQPGANIIEIENGIQASISIEYNARYI